MSQEAKLLPIAELPAPQQETFRRILAAIQAKDHHAARPLMGEILEYYVAHNREIPDEIEVAYANLLVVEESDASA
jgi:hypothetical protein